MLMFFPILDGIALVRTILPIATHFSVSVVCPSVCHNHALYLNRLMDLHAI